MPTVLLTGAAGFIGRAVHRLLARITVDCVAIDKQSAPSGQTQNLDPPIFVCDLLNPVALDALFTSHHFDTIIHLAAVLPGAASRDPISATRVNIGGSMALLECAITHGTRRFIFGSSTSVYGSAGTDAPISERTPAAPIDVYGAAKRVVEIVGDNLERSGSIEFLALRIATVTGRGARNTSSPWRSQIFEKLGGNEKILLPYDPCDPLTVVHVDDVASMLLALAQAKSLEHTIYNTPAELLSAAQLKQAVESAAPETHIELSGRTRALAPLADGSRFIQEFGFQITPFEQTLRAALLESGKQI